MTSTKASSPERQRVQRPVIIEGALIRREGEMLLKPACAQRVQAAHREPEGEEQIKQRIRTKGEQHEKVEGDAVQIIIPTEIITKLDKKSGDHKLVQDDQGKWSIDGISFTPIDGKFPDYERVLPKQKMSNEVAHFNPEYIARFVKVAKTLRSAKVAMVNISHNGQSGALVDVGIPDRFLGVMMPLRTDGGFTETPVWALAKEKQDA